MPGSGYSSDYYTSNHCPWPEAQSQSFHHKIFQWAVVFSYNSFFSLHTLAWACGLWFDLFSIFAFLISLFSLLHKQPHKILAAGDINKTDRHTSSSCTDHWPIQHGTSLTSSYIHRTNWLQIISIKILAPSFSWRILYSSYCS